MQAVNNRNKGGVDLDRRGLSLWAAAALAGCAAPPAAAPPPPAAPPAAPKVETPAPPPVENRSAEPPPLDGQEIQRAREALEAGQDETAEGELKKVLLSEPGNRQAQGLMRQIKDDPVTLLGRESFAYRVQPGESLSSIAKKFLGDAFLFYALARYNGIKVPRNLAGGQMIKVPGKAPAPPPPPPPPPPSPPPVVPPTQPVDETEKKRKAEIARLSRQARAAMARQDLDGAIRAWDEVLKLDPGNTTATLERQKAIDLKERLRTK